MKQIEELLDKIELFKKEIFYFSRIPDRLYEINSVLNMYGNEFN